MLLRWRSRCGRFELEGTLPSTRAAWQKIAELEEVFDVEQCGCCGSTSLFHDVRVFDGKQYFKLVCQECNAQIDYGLNTDGQSIFPRRYETETKQALPNDGWYVYQPKSPPPPPPATSKKGKKNGTEGTGNGS